MYVQHLPQTKSVETSTHIIHSPLNARATGNRLSWLVCYPRRINDVGRTTTIDAIDAHHLQFTVHHKRYLGRGAYATSAVAIGTIRRISNESSQVSYRVHIGKLYRNLLTFMTICVVLSLALVSVTILFLPLALLMGLVITLHWSYLLYDRQLLQYDINGVIHYDGKRKHEDDIIN